MRNLPPDLCILIARQGPDALLDDTGIAQAQAVNLGWKEQIKDNIPLPLTLYSSPMRRSASTLNITWHDILLDKGYLPYVSLSAVFSSRLVDQGEL